jgi:hypothetical protein
MTPDISTTTYSWGSIERNRRLRRETVFQAYDKDGDPILFGSASVIRPELGGGKWYVHPGPSSLWLGPAEARAKARVLLAAADECVMYNEMTT